MPYSVFYACINFGPEFGTLFLAALKELQSPLYFKIVFKLELREAGITFRWRTAVGGRTLLSHMIPSSVYMNVVAILGVWMKDPEIHHFKAFNLCQLQLRDGCCCSSSFC